MAARSLGTIWDRGIGILNTVRDAVTNTILAQLGDEVAAQDISDNAEWWQQIGFASRPSKPERGKAGPQSIILRGAQRDACIASRDVRCNAVYGSLDYGETCIFAPGEDGTGQARALLKNDGGVHLYTRVGNSTGGAGMVVQLDAQSNAIRLVNGAGYGIVIDESGITLTAGESALTLSSDGSVKLVGKATTQVDGASIVIGSVAVPVANSAVRGPSGLVAQASLKVLIE